MLHASIMTFGPYIHPTLQPDKFISLLDVPQVIVLSGKYSRKRKCGLLSMNVDRSYTSSAIATMLYFLQNLAIIFSSSSLDTWPVGLCGEQCTKIFTLFSLFTYACSSMSSVNTNPSSAFNGTSIKLHSVTVACAKYHGKTDSTSLLRLLYSTTLEILRTTPRWRTSSPTMYLSFHQQTIHF